MIRSALVAACFVLVVALPAGAQETVAATAATQETLPPVESVEASTRARWMIEGTVLDAKTGKPIKAFGITPGTDLIDSESGKTTVRWRDNLTKSMKDGRLQWPRTSGFSSMRFRITAKGYRPLVTQMMRRGGPHIRLRVKLTPTE